jgi:hypothetical protein
MPRVGAGRNGHVYRTSDGEFEIRISDTPKGRDGSLGRLIWLSRVLPDPTPGNSFDDYRFIRNGFGLTYGFDVSRAESSVDIPLLRTALLSFVDSTMQNRIIGGEK